MTWVKPTSLCWACSPRLLLKPRSRHHPGSYLFRSYKTLSISENFNELSIRLYVIIDESKQNLLRLNFKSLSVLPTNLTVCIPFKSSLSMWGLSLTAWATTSAASIVTSPKERLSSWKEACRRCSQTVGVSAMAGDWGRTYLDDGKSLSEDCSESNSSFWAHEAVTKVDHLNVPQVPKGLRGAQKQLVLNRRPQMLKSVLQHMKQGLTWAMASVPLLVKVLSLKLSTRSCGLWLKAEARAVTPA